MSIKLNFDLPEVVFDEYGHKHICKNVLSSGAQGVTCLTENPNVILKFLLYNGKLSTDENVNQEFEKRIAYIRTLPIDVNLPITMPNAMLQNYAGYRMTFLGGMESFEEHFLDSSAKNIKESYINTGGVRPRLLALGKMAMILAKLHSRGVYYGDISSNNIFITENEEGTLNKDEDMVVWFIDPDNLTEDKTSIFTQEYSKWAQNIGSTGCMAPEVFQGLAYCSLQSDIYAYALMSFELLCGCHAFHGKCYRQLDFSTRDQKADSCELPWIFDPDDDSNASKLMVSKEELFSPELLSLYWHIFCLGREEYLRWHALPDEERWSFEMRPPMMLWAEFMYKTFDNLNICPKCGMSFVNECPEKCPFCNEHYNAKSVLFTAKHNASGKILWKKRIVCDKETQRVSLPCRLFMPFDLDTYDAPILAIVINSSTILINKDIKCNNEIFYSIDNDEKSFRSLFRGINLPLSDLGKLRLRCGINIGRTIICELQ